MLLAGVRIIDRPGALHLFDGRRVVSLRGDDTARAAILAAIDGGDDGSGNDGSGNDDAARTRRDARDLLEQLRVVDETGTSHPPDDGPAGVAAAFVSAATAGWINAAQAWARIAETTVHVLEDSPSRLRAALSASGIRTRPLSGVAQIAGLDPRRDLACVAARSDQSARRLLEANEVCVGAGIALLPVGSYDGSVLRVGPLVIPGQSACIDCTMRRLSANVDYAELFRDVVADAPCAPTPPALRDWSYSLAALVLLRWLADRDVRLPGRLFTIAVDDLEIRQATVYRVPRCAVCSAPDFVGTAAPWEAARDH